MSDGIWSTRTALEYCLRVNASRSMALDILTRRHGVSTGIAFRLFAQAYEKRNEWIYVKDHHGTIPANKHLFITMQEMAEKLGFSFEWEMSGLRFRLKDA